MEAESAALSIGGAVIWMPKLFLNYIADKMQSFANSGYGFAIGWDDQYGYYIALGDECYYEFYGYQSGACIWY